MTIQFNNQFKEKRMDSDYYVEGYATTFSPYVLYYDEDGEEVREQIDRNAFSEAIMDDVILQYDHEGRVYARQSNNTLGLEVDDSGLFIYADLSKTSGSRALYEDINSGMITQMSWRFTVPSDGYTFDRITRTIHITKVREVFDVSAVSIPSNNKTSIYARSKELVEEVERQYKEEIAMQERLASEKKAAMEKKKKKIEIKLKLGGI